MTTKEAEDRLVETMVKVSREGSITSHEHGGTTFDGADAVSLMRHHTLVSALKMECVGLKSRRFNAWKLAKAEFGLKGNRDKVLADLQTLTLRAKARAFAILNPPDDGGDDWNADPNRANEG